MLVIGGSCIRAWSSTQATVATSSGEAELYALVKTASEGLGFLAVAKDLGVELSLEVFVDSTAAQSISCRAGLGRTKHVDVKYLWVQQATQGGMFVVKRVPGEQNPADILTKPHGSHRLVEVLHGVGVNIHRKDDSTVVVPSWGPGAEEPRDDGIVEFGELLAVWGIVESAALSPEVRRCWADFEDDDSLSEFNFGPFNPEGVEAEGGC
jgi:hypothetical protein